VANYPPVSFMGQNLQRIGNHCNPGKQYSWKTSHLRPLQPYEIDALTDIPRAWFQGEGWCPSERCDTQLIWEYAERHGLGGVTGSIAAAGKLGKHELISPSIQRYLSNSLYYEQTLNICRHIEKATEDLEINICFVKGPTLTSAAYHDSGIRSYSDIDVLLETKADVWKLIHSLQCNNAVEKASLGITKRFISPGRIHAWFRDWELEFFYPVDHPCEPMHEFLRNHKLSTMSHKFQETEISKPEPNFHLIFLIQHLAMHMCSRLIWFLDIAAFVRTNREQLDLEWISRELERLNLRNMSAVITGFCAKHIDPDFPVIAPGPINRNRHFQKNLVAPQRILERDYAIHQKSIWRKYYFYMILLVRYFLITDKHPLRAGLASRWSTSRLLNAFRLNNSILRWPLNILIKIFLFPIWQIATYLSPHQPNDDKVASPKAMNNKF
jgi:hypothetical protein